MLKQVKKFKKENRKEFKELERENGEKIELRGKIIPSVEFSLAKHRGFEC